MERNQEDEIESFRKVNNYLKGTIVELSGDVKSLQNENTKLHQTVEDLHLKIKASDQNLAGCSSVSELHHGGNSVTHEERPSKRPRNEASSQAATLSNKKFATEINKVARNFLGYLSLDDLLNCRLLSKDWKHEVDTFLEDPANRYLPHKTEDGTTKKVGAAPKYLLNDLDKRNSFSHAETLKIFARQFRNCNESPFIGKSVTFSLSLGNLPINEVPSHGSSLTSILDYRQESGYRQLNRHLYFRHRDLNILMCQGSASYWKNVEEFLSKLGAHVWYLKIEQKECGLTPEHLYKIIRNCLKHTPNLKALVVNGKFEMIADEPKTVDENGRFSRAPRKSLGHPAFITYESNISYRTSSFKKISPTALANLESVKFTLKEVACPESKQCPTAYEKYQKVIKEQFSIQKWKDFNLLNNVEVEFEILSEEEVLAQSLNNDPPDEFSSSEDSDMEDF